MQKNLNDETRALCKLFDAYNTGIFGGALPPCVVTIQRDGGLKANGYFTPWESWKATNGNETAAEIAITAEELKRPAVMLAETMLHECCHAANYAKGVKDCTRGGRFHNAKFAATAEAAGLIVEKDEKSGHVTTGFESGSTAEKIALKWANSNGGVFEKYRYQPEKAKPARKKSETFKYKCPCCDAVVSSKLGTLKIRCIECGVDFEKQG